MKGYGIKELFPDYLRILWKGSDELQNKIQEIRLRIHRPVIIYLDNQEFYLKKSGGISKDGTHAYKVEEKDIENILNYLCNYSIYAYEEEMKLGFFTIEGGHRIGITGQVIIENNQINNIKNISSMNIRIAHEIVGTGNVVLPYLYKGEMPYNTLIISNPGCGKTTLLRDMIRLVSNGNLYGNGMTVGVVDERSELAGTYHGIPQNDVGSRTDILDACPKVLGIMMLIRSMTPKVIAVDEIGSSEDMEALVTAMGCGCRVIATVHASDIEELKEKEWFCKYQGSKLFERIIEMGRGIEGCKIKHIYNEKDEILCM